VDTGERPGIRTNLLLELNHETKPVAKTPGMHVDYWHLLFYLRICSFFLRLLSLKDITFWKNICREDIYMCVCVCVCVCVSVSVCLCVCIIYIYVYICHPHSAYIYNILSQVDSQQYYQLLSIVPFSFFHSAFLFFFPQQYYQLLSIVSFSFFSPTVLSTTLHSVFLFFSPQQYYQLLSIVSFSFFFPTVLSTTLHSAFLRSMYQGTEF
jgi:hypothetical protein